MGRSPRWRSRWRGGCAPPKPPTTRACGCAVNPRQTTVEQALIAASRCQASYEEAPPHIRRQINQGFFKRLFIGPDGSVERYELTEPYAVLLAVVTTTRQIARRRPRTSQTRPVPIPKPGAGP
jgi:hypothetical protein